MICSIALTYVDQFGKFSNFRLISSDLQYHESRSIYYRYHSVRHLSCVFLSQWSMHSFLQRSSCTRIISSFISEIGKIKILRTIFRNRSSFSQLILLDHNVYQQVHPIRIDWRTIFIRQEEIIFIIKIPPIIPMYKSLKIPTISIPIHLFRQQRIRAQPVLN